MLVAQSALEQAKARRAEQEAVDRKLESYSSDPARANALGPVLQGARVSSRSRRARAADAEARASAVEVELGPSSERCCIRAELARVDSTLAQANSKLEAMNDAGDFQRIEHDLEAEYLALRARAWSLRSPACSPTEGSATRRARFRQARVSSPTNTASAPPRSVLRPTSPSRTTRRFSPATIRWSTAGWARA